MCGIFGIISNKNFKVHQALSRLEMLEYRGYDSAGVSLVNKNKLHIIKTVGYIKNLYPLSTNKKSKNIICHTRWATHGKINEKNTHPHKAGKLCIVHNGIVENYYNLITSYNLKGKLQSECDTEVLAHVIELHTRENMCIENIIDALQNVKGSYSILIQHEQMENCLFGAKNLSPLYIGVMESGFVLSSDLIAFQGLATQFYTLNDLETFEIRDNTISFYNKHKEKIEKQTDVYVDSFFQTSLSGFSSFLEKEINDIPQALCFALYNYSNSVYNLPDLSKYKCIHIIACGTAYHSACAGKYIIEKHIKVPVQCHIASEFLYEEHISFSPALYIFISQSGETFDTVQCAKLVKQLKFHTLAITNTITSQLSSICTYCLPIYAGKEVSVASTKVYNCTLLAIYFLCKKTDIEIDAKLLNELIASEKENKLVDMLLKAKQAIFIGKCEDYVTAMEGVLKYRELTYNNAIAYPSGELKHGTLSLIDQDTLTIAILTNEKYKPSIINALNEIKTRMGKTALITTLEFSPDVADYVIKLQTSKLFPINLYSVIPMQKIAFIACKKLGLNADKPRNLAKSVTVQ